jgi:hypothetical protein
LTSHIAISGLECVQALCIAGFRVKQRLPGSTVLTRADTGGQTVVVPDALVLPGDVLDTILGGADISADRFLWLLGEVTTDTELMAL